MRVRGGPLVQCLAYRQWQVSPVLLWTGRSKGGALPASVTHSFQRAPRTCAQTPTWGILIVAAGEKGEYSI